MGRAFPIGRLPGAHLIVWSDGEVTAPTECWDDECEAVEAGDVACTQVVVAKDFTYALIELREIDLITVH